MVNKTGITKSKLAIILSKLAVFDKPELRTEQYPMDSEIGAEVLWNAYLKGDISEKVIADLGCGTGILGIGALILGAKKVYLIDNDDSALKIAKNSLKKAKSEFKILGKAEFLLQDIKDIKEFLASVDTVLMNPPFGTRIMHSDKIFLEQAFKISSVVYSFHKSETKDFIFKFSEKNRFKVDQFIDFRFPLKASQRFHRRKIYRIEVSCFRFVKGNLQNKKLFK